MTGLNLETFLHLLRVAPGAWASLGVAAIILALMTWTSWGSRRVLRKCLFLSIAAHIALIFYGGSSPAIQRYLRLGSKVHKPDRAIERIKVTSFDDSARAERDPSAQKSPTALRPVAAWDRDPGVLALAEATRPLARPDRPDPAPAPALEAPRAAESTLPANTAPEVASPEPPASEPPRKINDLASETVQAPAPIVEAVTPGEGAAVPTPEPMPTAESAPAPVGLPVEGGIRSRLRPRSQPTRLDPSATPSPDVPGAPVLPLATPVATLDRDLIPPVTSSSTPSPKPGDDPARPIASPAPEPPTPIASNDEPMTDPNPAPPPASSPTLTTSLLPQSDIRRSIRPGRPAIGSSSAPAPARTFEPSRSGSNLGDLARVTPSISSAIPSLPKATGRRPLAEVPSVYRSRLDPNRTALAQRAGASQASEQAVERALEWLARHQDADGRWDGGTVKYRDGHVADTDDTFIVHCPPGDICFGECFYGEADTALTGLSLLAYLGSGYTHVDGTYKDTVGRGLNFLRQSQKPDGDLRGSSLAVGMYCHSMATLALCEAYALTGDPALRLPVEKGVTFLLRSRAADGLAWRYAPGDKIGDTSILGWVVMALKSAKTVGIPIPPPVQGGIATWLDRVSSGRSAGLARYQPGAKVTPTITAEAWACRQFLEMGGPGPASDEAAASLLDNPSDRGDFNIYYLYYGTLAMYQHGGSAWSNWNARVRDQVVSRQQTKGHKAGSWDPDDSPYGTHGGRIYTTALATLTLEVYYRFLRLYSTADKSNPLIPRPSDNGTRRAGLNLPGPAAGR